MLKTVAKRVLVASVVVGVASQVFLKKSKVVVKSEPTLPGL